MWLWTGCCILGNSPQFSSGGCDPQIVELSSLNDPQDWQVSSGTQVLLLLGELPEPCHSLTGSVVYELKLPRYPAGWLLPFWIEFLYDPEVWPVSSGETGRAVCPWNGGAFLRKWEKLAG